MNTEPSSQRSAVRYVVRWGRLTEMLALSASVMAIAGFMMWGG